MSTTTENSLNETRFSSWSHLETFSRFGTQDSSIRSFFNGTDVSKRMNDIRKAITWIRHHWEDYEIFMGELKRSFLGTTSAADDKGKEGMDFRWAMVESKGPRQWADRTKDGTIDEGFGFLKLYTSQQGYDRIFSVLNGAFRSDSLVGEEIRLRAAVFLVELLTIELFNYTYQPNSKGNLGYTGVLYRGMALSEENLGSFRRLMIRPVEERYWSVPLSFMSCTVERRKAIEFAEPSAKSDSTLHRVLLRVHVVGLSEGRLALYSARFPSSVVTPICAVDISNLSDFPEEREVVLRGPFFQLVGISQESTEKGKHLFVLDVLVFNTNRDHPSTMEMSDEEGDRARALFACLIEGERAERCLEIAPNIGRAEDEEAYRRILERSRMRSAEIIG
ncbi:hypothetical protein AN958_10471 [Leucoagaricus sp. SymC.cos]|nr:hypothetical protein AN958_10471 [Leucoagaricus sp. SymC.cos]